MNDMDAPGGAEWQAENASARDVRRWLRDQGALLALPALWVDHSPEEIATGLLSVLSGILQLDGSYARFDGADASQRVSAWRPAGPRPAKELGAVLETERAFGLSTTVIDGDERGLLRVSSLRLTLPWEDGLVLVSAGRHDFPTAMETHLLRVAVSQAAIAIHTARRIARERAATHAAEDMLRRQNEILQALVHDIEPSLTTVSNRVGELAHNLEGIDLLDGSDDARRDAKGRRRDEESQDLVAPPPLTPPNTLTRREMEVLGLLAQGLSNREIAAVLWLSERTVERHITSLYRKIGVARRSEATAFALRHGMA